MGLLTNPKTPVKFHSVMRKFGNKVCVLSYLAGVVSFVALAHRPLNAGTYFSENALLPGLVEPSFYNAQAATDYLKEIRDEMQRLLDLDTREEHPSYKIPSAWFEEKFRSLGLDVYTQNYSFSYPVDILKDQVFHGQNVYGILRAPRASSTEAVVLSAPYRPPAADRDRTTGGVALMLALAKEFRKHTYWAKDIIFLMTEHEEIGMHAWLSAYHDSPSTYIRAGELESRSGSIQAALNLEIAGDSVHRFNIKLEGLNGQLPNLDLVNTVSRLCRREGIPPALHKRINPSNPESRDGFEAHLRTMVAMMWAQAPGFPTGNHGLFHRFHIEAVTLQGYRVKGGKRAAGFPEMGRVIEGIFRSLNNLLERFHQSFFFYLLPATDRYVSIGLYMIPFGLITLPVVLKALYFWLSSTIKETEFNQKREQEKKQKETEKVEKEEEEFSDDEEKSQGAESGDKVVPDDGYPGLLSLVPVLVMVGILAVIAHNGPRFSVQTGAPFHLPPGESLLWGAVALHFTAALTPRLLRRKGERKGDTSGPNPTLLKCVALFALGTSLAALSVINISLAFFIALVWVPVVLVIRPSKRRLVNWGQYVLLQLISPLSLLFVVSSVEHLPLLGAKRPDPLDVAQRTLKSAQSSLVLTVIDAHMYGNWLHTLVTCVLFPNWLLFWALLWTNPELY